MEPPAALLLGRYRVDGGPPLGTGGWCIVRRAADVSAGGKAVAVKAFNAQAMREPDETLAQRFAREVGIFRELGVAPASASAAAARAHCPWLPGAGVSPRDLLVNLVDFSREGGEGSAPGRAPDGHYYSVLELADYSLDEWLGKRRDAGQFVGAQQLRDIACAVANALAWLHQHDICHLDIKPDNIMHFAGVWKLIDLEGCMRRTGGSRVSQGNFTPLYASPELAGFVLEGHPSEGLVPSGAMDIWAAGIVLLDVLAHTAILQETKSGFDAAALFEDEAVPFEAWYRWVAHPEPFNIEALLTAPASSVELYRSSAHLQELLRLLLERDPARRPSAREVQRHPFLLGPAAAVGRVPTAGTPDAGAEGGVRTQLELAFTKAEQGGHLGTDGCLPTATFLALFCRMGLRRADAALLLAACNPSQKERLPYGEFLDFLYR